MIKSLGTKLSWIVVMAFLIGCSEDSSISDKISLGSEVYYTNCTSCHDSGMAPNLSSTSLNISEIVYKVTHGEGGGMPSFINTLTKNEIESVAFYILR